MAEAHEAWVDEMLADLGGEDGSRPCSTCCRGSGGDDMTEMRSDREHFLRDRRTGSRRSRLNRPERKNPLTFDSYAELRDWFRDLPMRRHHAVVFGPTAAISARAATCTTSSAR
jgi:hypothetical protein